MKNILSMEDVRQVQMEALQEEFGNSLSEGALNEVIDGRLSKAMAVGIQEGIVKGMVTGGGIATGGTTGADAAKVEDLSTAIGLQALNADHATSWNLFPKKAVISDAVEHTTADSIGEVRGGGYVDPTATDGGTQAIDGSLERKFLTLKWYAAQFMTFQNAMSVTSIGFNGGAAPGQAGNNNQYMAMQRHVRQLNWATLNANSSKNSLQPDGVIAQIQNAHTSSRQTRFDMNNQPMTPETLADLAGMIYANSGSITDVMFGVGTLTDYQKQLSARQRSSFDSEHGMLSYPDKTLVQALGADPTRVKLHRDIDLDANPQLSGHLQAVSGAPSAPTSAAGVASTGTENWRGLVGIRTAATYIYGVAAANSKGNSVVTESSGVAVTVGQKVTLTITRSDTATREYIIYRGTVSGKLKELTRVKCTGATDEFVDNGEKEPGTATALALTIAPMGDGRSTIEICQLFPMAIIDLPRTLMAFNKSYLTGMTPRVNTPFKQVVIENIARYSA